MTFRPQEPNDNTEETIEIDQLPALPEMPGRVTDPLDLDTPRQLRFTVSETGESFDVPVSLYMVVGRKTSRRDRQVHVDLTPFDAKNFGVSRYHAIIQVIDDRISIKDFNSTNGTYLNNHTLRPAEMYRLRHGDTISFGRFKVTVHFLGFQDD